MATEIGRKELITRSNHRFNDTVPKLLKENWDIRAGVWLEFCKIISREIGMEDGLAWGGLTKEVSTMFRLIRLCPRCRARIFLRARVGQRVTCPECKSVFTAA
jgi:ribosomal protein S27AE